MKSRWLNLAIFLLVTAVSLPLVLADDDGRQFSKDASFTTLITTPRGIEGLTGDGAGNLYTGGSGPSPCPIWRINLHSPSLTIVGNVPKDLAGNCGFSGIALDELGNLYQADGGAGRIYIFKKPNAENPPDATIFASGIPGTNGLAFDHDGNLWTGDGTTGKGRVWKITGANADCSVSVNCVEVFRIQPLANEVNLDATGAGGIGRDVRDLPAGTITVTETSRNAANTLGSQPLVANGIVFNRSGDMFVIDTARGALWRIELKRAKFNQDGSLRTGTGCDTTFTPNTLCLSNVFVAHPILEGGDGIALDRDENIWVDANERNAVAVVTKKGEVFEVFRNPVNASGLRSSADASVGNNRILEFPTSPFLSGRVLCTSQSDGNRRDNFPNSAGEANGANPLGKISCMDQELRSPGLPLPVH